MQFPIFSTTVAITTLAISTSATGINCAGSGACALAIAGNSARELSNYINNIDDNRYYQNGEHIACATFSSDEGTQGHVCAFLQNSNGAPGHSIRALAHYIPDHGCKECGSVPLFYPGDNNVANGELTFNVVGSNACGDGLC
jgi:hypothetical protein